jgi:RNA polymerase sigma-70 factor (ECF subfamily)
MKVTTRRTQASDYKPTQHRDFEALFGPVMSKLQRYARRLARDPSDADDLVQDVLLKIYRYPERWPDEAGAAAWLMRVTYNVFVDSYRRRGQDRETISLDQFVMEARESGEDSGDLSSDFSTVSDPIAENCELSDLISLSLRSLPARYRRMVYWHDIEGLSTHEIAERLNIPLNTVRSTINRGHHMIRSTQQAVSDLKGPRAMASA